MVAARHPPLYASRQRPFRRRSTETPYPTLVCSHYTTACPQSLLGAANIYANRRHGGTAQSGTEEDYRHQVGKHTYAATALYTRPPTYVAKKIRK